MAAVHVHGSLGDLHDYCKNHDATAVENLMRSEMGAIGHPKNLRDLNYSLSSAYRRGYSYILAVFIRRAVRGCHAGSPLADYTLTTLRRWKRCAMEREFDHGLAILVTAESIAGVELLDTTRH